MKDLVFINIKIFNATIPVKSADSLKYLTPIEWKDINGLYFVGKVNHNLLKHY